MILFIKRKNIEPVYAKEPQLTLRCIKDINIQEQTKKAILEFMHLRNQSHMHYFSNIYDLIRYHSAALSENLFFKPYGIFRAQSGVEPRALAIRNPAVNPSS